VEPAEFIWKLFGWACFFGSDHVSINYSILKLRNKVITIINSKSMREKEFLGGAVVAAWGGTDSE
jgi:hypothetical protein